MNTLKWTLGPWKWDGTMNSRDIFIHTGNINDPLAIVRGKQVGMVEAAKPSEASGNARLIALAPEMAEALAEFEAATQSGSLEATRQAGIKARAILAKLEAK